MCTLALYFKAFQKFPLLIAANRDEHYDRPSLTPDLIETEPAIIAGKDLRVGGTWMGVNEKGMFVGILNRRANGAINPVVATRSRGLLCMDLLMRASAYNACDFIREHRQPYQPFTVVVADENRAWAAYNGSDGVLLVELSQGLHVFSSHAEVNLHSEKGDRASKQFATLLTDLAPGRDDRVSILARLQLLLSDHSVPADGEGARGEAICVHGEMSGTVSASVAVLSAADRQFEFFHCPGAPCRNIFGEALRLALR